MEFFLSTLPLWMWFLVWFELSFAVLLFLDFLRGKKAVTFCLFLIVLGLLADALLVLIGSHSGGLSEGAGRISFILYGVLIPLIFPICGYALHLNKNAMIGVWVFAAVLIVVGCLHAFYLNLEMIQIGPVMRYVVAESSAKWAAIYNYVLSIVLIALLVIVGLVVLIKEKDPFLFVAGILIFVASALCKFVFNDFTVFVGMIGDVCLACFLWIYDRYYIDLVEFSEFDAGNVTLHDVDKDDSDDIDDLYVTIDENTEEEKKDEDNKDEVKKDEVKNEEVVDKKDEEVEEKKEEVDKEDNTSTTSTAKKAGRTYYHLKKRPDGKWEVVRRGGVKAIKLFRTKKEALEFCSTMVSNQGGTLLVHASKGKNKGRFMKV